MKETTKQPENVERSAEAPFAARNGSAICCICNKPLTDSMCFGNETERWHTHCADRNKRLPRRYDDSPDNQALPQGGAKKGNDEH